MRTIVCFVALVAASLVVASVDARFILETVREGTTGGNVNAAMRGVTTRGDIGLGADGTWGNNTDPCGFGEAATSADARMVIGYGEAFGVDLSILESFDNIEPIEFSILEGVNPDFSNPQTAVIPMGTTDCGNPTFPCSETAMTAGIASDLTSADFDTAAVGGKLFTMQIFYPANGGYYQCADLLVNPEFAGLQQGRLTALYVDGLPYAPFLGDGYDQTGDFNYAISVANAVTSVDFAVVTKQQANPGPAVVTYELNGGGAMTATDFTATPLAESPATNTLVITVTANGAADVSTFTFDIERRVVSTDANLTSISLSGLYFDDLLVPAFDQDVVDYTVDVDVVDSVTIFAATADAGASVSIDGGAGTSGTIALALGANNVDIVVTAEDGMATKTYTVVFNRVATSAVAAVGLVEFHGVYNATLSPVFDPTSNGPYTLDLEFSENFVGVTVDRLNPATNVSINGIYQDTDIIDATATSTVTVDTTSEDLANSMSYVFNLNRAASANSDSSLGSLQLLGMVTNAYTPGFSGGVLSYSANAGFTDDQVTVVVSPAYPISVVEINGVQTLELIVPLAYGENTITIDVTAEDGVAVSNYVITIPRQEPAGNADASSIEIVGLADSGLTPSFGVGVFSYDANAMLDENLAVVSAQAADPSATLTINGVQTGSRIVSLVPGDNTINIRIVAENLLTTRLYVLNIYRQPPSTNSMLATLAVSGLGDNSLSPPFSPTTYDYMVTARFNEPAANVTATKAQADALLTIAETLVTTYEVLLAPGDNVVEVTVLAQDGITQSNYTVNVYQAPASNNSALATLSVSGITSPVLNPPFAPTTTTYMAMAGSGDSTVDIAATASSGFASVMIDGAPTTAATGLALSVGDNLFDVVVTAEDSTTSTYTVNVYLPSPEARLSNLELAGLLDNTISPSFAMGTFTYEADAAFEDTQVTFSAVPVDSNVASITYAGNTSNVVNLALGSNAVDVVIVAEDMVGTQTYTVTVTRSATPTNLGGDDSSDDGRFGFLGPTVYAGVGFLLICAVLVLACCVCWKVKKETGKSNSTELNDV